MNRFATTLLAPFVLAASVPLLGAAAVGTGLARPGRSGTAPVVTTTTTTTRRPPTPAAPPAAVVASVPAPPAPPPAVRLPVAAPAAVVAPAPRPAPADSGVSWEVARGNQALASLRYPWRDLGYDVVFLPGRPGLLALTRFDQRRIEVYVRAGESVAAIAHNLAHEFGHVVDDEYNTAERRGQWLARRGIDPSTPWYGCDGCTDYATPAGDYAESFAWWLAGHVDFRGQLGPPPTDAQLADLVPLFQPGG